MRRQSPRRFRHRRSFKVRVVIGLFGVLCIAASMFVLVEKTDVFKIRTITVEGATALAKEEIERSANDFFSAPLWGPIESNMAFMPIKRLTQRLLAEFPRIENLEIRRAFRLREVRLVVRERTTAGIYCPARPVAAPTVASPEDEGTNPQRELLLGQCFLMDRNAILFGEAPQTEGGLILSLVDIRDNDPGLRDEAIPPQAFDAIEGLWEAFHADVRVGIGRIIRDGDAFLIVQTLEGWEALFDPTQDIRAQSIALRELLEKELPSQKRVGISTIDLRVPGKIYYK